MPRQGQKKTKAGEVTCGPIAAAEIVNVTLTAGDHDGGGDRDRDLAATMTAAEIVNVLNELENAR